MINMSPNYMNIFSEFLGIGVKNFDSAIHYCPAGTIVSNFHWAKAHPGFWRIRLSHLGGYTISETSRR
jgi:hypothetical protein